METRTVFFTSISSLWTYERDTLCVLQDHRKMTLLCRRANFSIKRGYPSSLTLLGLSLSGYQTIRFSALASAASIWRRRPPWQRNQRPIEKKRWKSPIGIFSWKIVFSYDKKNEISKLQLSRRPKQTFLPFRGEASFRHGMPKIKKKLLLTFWIFATAH